MAVVLPAPQGLEPASRSGHPLLAEAVVGVAVPSRPAAELRLLAAVGVVALEAAEASPCRQTCRPEAMQQAVAAEAVDPSEQGLRPAASLVHRRAAPAYPAHGPPSRWQMHSDRSAK